MNVNDRCHGGKCRFQLLLIFRGGTGLRALALEGRNAAEEKFGRKYRVIVDVDPVNLM